MALSTLTSLLVEAVVILSLEEVEEWKGNTEQQQLSSQHHRDLNTQRDTLKDTQGVMEAHFEAHLGFSQMFIKIQNLIVTILCPAIPI